MATRKRAGSKRGASAEPERSQLAEAAAKVQEQLPEIPEIRAESPAIYDGIRFPALVAASMVVSYFLYTLTSPFTSGDLSTVSAHRDKSHEVLFFLAWRAAELGIGWYANYDSKWSERKPPLNDMLMLCSCGSGKLNFSGSPTIPLLPYQLLQDPSNDCHSLYLH